MLRLLRATREGNLSWRKVQLATSETRDLGLYTETSHTSDRFESQGSDEAYRVYTRRATLYGKGDDKRHQRFAYLVIETSKLDNVHFLELDTPLADRLMEAVASSAAPLVTTGS
jgi:hypothetical protein